MTLFIEPAQQLSNFSYNWLSTYCTLAFAFHKSPILRVVIPANMLLPLFNKTILPLCFAAFLYGSTAAVDAAGAVGLAQPATETLDAAFADASFKGLIAPVSKEKFLGEYGWPGSIARFLSKDLATVLRPHRQAILARIVELVMNFSRHPESDLEQMLRDAPLVPGQSWADLRLLRRIFAEPELLGVDRDAGRPWMSPIVLTPPVPDTVRRYIWENFKHDEINRLRVEAQKAGLVTRQEELIDEAFRRAFEESLAEFEEAPRQRWGLESLRNNPHVEIYFAPEQQEIFLCFAVDTGTLLELQFRAFENEVPSMQEQDFQADSPLYQTSWLIGVNGSVNNNLRLFIDGILPRIQRAVSLRNRLLNLLSRARAFCSYD